MSKPPGVMTPEMQREIALTRQSFEILQTVCVYLPFEDNDCHHPERDFDCVSCAPCNCPLLL
jgi:hypothetical protein